MLNYKNGLIKKFPPFISYKGKIIRKYRLQTRAIIFNCFENLGTYPNEQFRTYLNKIFNDDKTYLSKLGIRIGARFFYTKFYEKIY